MTHEEFLKKARDEIRSVFTARENRLINLVEQAWAEGKRHAETEYIEKVLLEAMKGVTTTTTWPYQPIEPMTPDIQYTTTSGEVKADGTSD